VFFLLRGEFEVRANKFLASFTNNPDADYTKHYLGVFFNGFFEALDRQTYTWMATDVFNEPLLSAVYDEGKSCLGWTQMGTIADQLEKKGLLQPPVDTPTQAISIYTRFGTADLPRFIEKLSMLCNTRDPRKRG